MSVRLLLASLLTLGLLAACASLVPTPAPTAAPIATPTALIIPPTPTPQTERPTLRLWLPTRFDPKSNAVLQARLDAFAVAHPTLKLEVRLKEEVGETSLLQSLLLTSAAAPAALPDLVAINRTEMDEAVHAGVLQPLDAATTALNDADWYAMARALGRMDNVTYGLPFALDPLVLVTRLPHNNMAWQDVFNGGMVTFNGSRAELALALYLSTGGKLTDENGQPSLDPDSLARVLNLFSQGKFVSAASEAEVWAAYRRDSESAAGWLSVYQSSGQAEGSVEALPQLEDSPATLIDGWGWSVASLDIEHQRLAVELAVWLTDGAFLKEWSAATGFVSPRPSAQSPYDPILQNARILPAADVLKVIDPVLQEAVTSVLQGGPPSEAAQAALDRLK